MKQLRELGRVGAWILWVVLFFIVENETWEYDSDPSGEGIGHLFHLIERAGVQGFILVGANVLVALFIMRSQGHRPPLLTCPTCGVRADAGATYCPACGTAASSGREEYRRRVES